MSLAIDLEQWCLTFTQNLKHIRALKELIAQHPGLSVKEYILDTTVHSPLLTAQQAQDCQQEYEQVWEAKQVKLAKEFKQGKNVNYDPNAVPPTFTLEDCLITKNDLLFSVVGNKKPMTSCYYHVDNKIATNKGKIFRVLFHDHTELNQPHIKMMDPARYVERLKLCPEHDQLFADFTAGKLPGCLLIAVHDNRGYLMNIV